MTENPDYSGKEVFSSKDRILLDRLERDTTSCMFLLTGFAFDKTLSLPQAVQLMCKNVLGYELHANSLLLVSPAGVDLHSKMLRLRFSVNPTSKLEILARVSGRDNSLFVYNKNNKSKINVHLLLTEKQKIERGRAVAISSIVSRRDGAPKPVVVSKTDFKLRLGPAPAKWMILSEVMKKFEISEESVSEELKNRNNVRVNKRSANDDGIVDDMAKTPKKVRVTTPKMRPSSSGKNKDKDKAL